MYFCTGQPSIISHVYRTRENNTNLYPVTSKDPEDIILKTKKEARASRIPLPATSTTELNQKERENKFQSCSAMIATNRDLLITY
jgi:hypothetical protein